MGKGRTKWVKSQTESLIPVITTLRKLRQLPVWGQCGPPSKQPNRGAQTNLVSEKKGK